MLHITCSSRRMGLGRRCWRSPRACAREVIIPEHIQCCGFAGDKGLMTPELNAAALCQPASPGAQRLPSGFQQQPHLRAGGSASTPAFPITASFIWWIRRRDKESPGRTSSDGAFFVGK